MVPRVDVENGLDALLGDARRLLERDSASFLRVLALCRAYLSIYEEPHESLDELLARCQMIYAPEPRRSA